MQTTANNLIKAAFGLVSLLNGDGSLTPAADARRKGGPKGEQICRQRQTIS
ncbi:MAG: hypothetical protein WCR95_04340 [Eubacteriales bacterium]